MIRRKEHKPPILKPWGGCIPYVGDDCLKEEFRFKNMGIIWLDCGVCVNCPNKPCKYFKEWKENLK